MANTLEQKTEIEDIETEIKPCHYCNAELQIPKGISLKKDTKYDGFYISPCGALYCDKYCFNMFTED